MEGQEFDCWSYMRRSYSEKRTMALSLQLYGRLFFILGRVRCAKIYEQVVVVRRKLYRCDLRVGKQYRVFVKCDYGYIFQRDDSDQCKNVIVHLCRSTISVCYGKAVL